MSAPLPERAATRELRFPDLVRWIARHWRPYRREVPLLALLTIVHPALIVVYPILIKRVIETIERAERLEQILQNAAILVGFGIVQFAIHVLLQGMRARNNVRFDYGVRMRSFENILRMGPSFFQRFRTGDIVTRLTDDVSEKLSWYMCSGLLRTAEAVLIVVLGVIMMVRLNPTLALYSAGPLPILVALFFVTASRLHQRYERVQKSISDLNDALETSFSGIRAVKAFAAERAQSRTVARAIEGQRAAEVRAVRWQAIIDSLYGHIWQLSIVGVLLGGGAMAIRNEITIGELVAFDVYVLLLVWPMFDFGNFLVRGRISAVSIGRLRELEEFTPEVREIDEQSPAPRRPYGAPVVGDREEALSGTDELAVRFEDVSYAYPGAAGYALRNLSFEAAPGMMTAIAGEIGSGKSTAIALVPRLVDPTAGRIVIGGRDARGWVPGDLRRRIGYVSQEAVLFSTTIGENIRLGRSLLPEEAMNAAIDAAGLREEIGRWPRGLETRVGSRGLRLSGGQKQRVALARALAGRPSILLLDDCTASLDAAKEDEIWQAILALLPTCTTIVVTHRPATLEKAHRIVVLGQGRPVEIGSFDDLNRAGTRFHGLYARWRLTGQAE